MDAVFAWLDSIPPAALYIVLAAAAATENVFPPFPADTVVAFGSFLAARGRASFAGAFLAVWLGSIAGAMAVYALGRRVGARRPGWHSSSPRRAAAVRRLRAFYQRRGLIALAVSRFVPGIRALVPPFAGALRIPAWQFATIIAAASAVWYGIISFVAYRAGADWGAVEALVVSITRRIGVVGTIVALVALGVWSLIWRGRRRAGEQESTQDG